MRRKIIRKREVRLTKALYLKWMAATIFTLLVLSTLGLIFTSFYLEIDRKYELYQMQNECISKYVQQGVERRDIIRIPRGCKVK